MAREPEICDGCHLPIHGDTVRQGAIHTGLMMRRGVVTHSSIECQRAARESGSETDG